MRKVFPLSSGGLSALTVEAGKFFGLAGRLVEARNRLGLTQKEMASHLDVSLHTYMRSEQDRRAIDVNEVAKLAQLGIEIGWLLTGNRGFGEGQSQFQHQISGDANPDTAATDRAVMAGLGDEFVLLPRYDVQASAGAGALIHSEQIVDYLAFKADWVRDRLGRRPSDLLLLEASGDSMQPTIHHGDLLLVDRSTDHLRDSAIYVLANGGELMVKRVERRMAGGIVIRSDNARYEPETFSADEAEALRVIGQVVWHGGLL
jgi:phage repressor protein C with HTH and peptisase S24 domain